MTRPWCYDVAAFDAKARDGIARPDLWKAGGAYERYVERWSALVARAFVQWLAVEPGSTWLDLGCGTGALTRTVLEQAAPRRVIGVDPSDGFLSHARARIEDARAEFRSGDAQALPLPDASVDAAAPS